MSEMIASDADCALLVIDMQQALVPGAYLETGTIAAINHVVQKARGANRPVIYLQHCHQQYKPMMKGEPGWAIHSSMDLEPSDERIEKTASDSFYKTDLAARLKDLDIQQLIVTGMQTEFCVDATCRAALSHDFDVILIADGHTTGDSGLKAKEVIQHHNELLANLAHPSSKLTLVNSTQLSLG